MVGRIRLIFWSVLDRLHVRLHEMMDRRNLEHWTAEAFAKDWDSNVHYMDTE